MERDYRAAAERYCPNPLKVLFIAESPPAFTSEAKRSYFFFEDNPGGDMLFATIIQAVLGIDYRKAGPQHKAEVLKLFQASGYWLMDAVEFPINRIDGRTTTPEQRRQKIDAASKELLERLSELSRNRPQDLVIVLIKNIVYECLSEKLRLAGYCVPQTRAIGFPRYHRDRDTIAGIRRVLADGLGDSNSAPRNTASA